MNHRRTHEARDILKPNDLGYVSRPNQTRVNFNRPDHITKRPLSLPLPPWPSWLPWEPRQTLHWPTKMIIKMINAESALITLSCFHAFCLHTLIGDHPTFSTKLWSIIKWSELYQWKAFKCISSLISIFSMVTTNYRKKQFAFCTEACSIKGKSPTTC